jgi:hypothetical protein
LERALLITRFGDANKFPKVLIDSLLKIEDINERISLIDTWQPLSQRVGTKAAHVDPPDETEVKPEKVPVEEKAPSTALPQRPKRAKRTKKKEGANSPPSSPSSSGEEKKGDDGFTKVTQPKREFKGPQTQVFKFRRAFSTKYVQDAVAQLRKYCGPGRYNLTAAANFFSEGRPTAAPDIIRKAAEMASSPQ